MLFIGNISECLFRPSGPGQMASRRLSPTLRTLCENESSPTQRCFFSVSNGGGRAQSSPVKRCTGHYHCYYYYNYNNIVYNIIRHEPAAVLLSLSLTRRCGSLDCCYKIPASSVALLLRFNLPDKT